MNDQWSGKTLLSADLTNDAAPTRSSNHSETFLITASAPEARADRLREVAESDDVSAFVHLDGKTGERTRCRSRVGLGVLKDLEDRLVARAEQLLSCCLVETHRTSRV